MNRICLILFCLLEDVVVAQLHLLNVVVQAIELNFCPFGFVTLEPEFSQQLSIVAFGLMEGFVEAGIGRFAISDLLF